MGAAITIRSTSVPGFFFENITLPCSMTAGIASREAIFSAVMPCLISDFTLALFNAMSPNVDEAILFPRALKYSRNKSKGLFPVFSSLPASMVATASISASASVFRATSCSLKEGYLMLYLTFSSLSRLSSSRSGACEAKYFARRTLPIFSAALMYSFCAVFSVLLAPVPPIALQTATSLSKTLRENYAIDFCLDRIALLCYTMNRGLTDLRFGRRQGWGILHQQGFGRPFLF